MIAFMERGSFSAMEEFALTTYELKLGNLYDFKGTNFFYNDDLAGALKWFEKAGFGDLSYGDPFAIHINDCHDCDHAEELAERYSKIEFVKRLMQLKSEMGINPAVVANNSYLLGNAYYNATYYGNYRDFYYNAIFDDWYYFTPFEGNDEGGNYAGLENMSTAMQYYRDALEASSDPEFRAQCVFMLAKCEQNIYFSFGDSEYDCPSPKGCDFIAGKYFRELEDEYAGTEYFQQVLQECGYFATYMKSK
jgi:hypothetical protein